MHCGNEMLTETVVAELSAFSRHGRLTVDNRPCTPVMLSQMATLLSLFVAQVISIRQCYYYCDFDKNLSEKTHCLIFASTQLDYCAFVTGLISVDDVLIRHMGAWEASYSDWKSFKAYLSERVAEPRVMMIVEWLKRPIQSFINTADLTALRDLRSVFSFLKKGNIDRDDLLLNSLQSFLDREHSLTYCAEIVSPLRDILKRMLKDFVLDEYVFHYSGGATAECRRGDVISMYENTKIPFFCDYVLRTEGLYSPNGERSFDVLDEMSDTPIPQCELTWVPKTYKAQRLIAKQPASLLVGQQALRSQLQQFIEKDEYLHRHIPLSDAEVCRRACLKASKNRDFVTVDQSAASDSIHNELVKAVFPEPLLHHLQMWRATEWSVDSKCRRRIESLCESYDVNIPSFSGKFVMFAPMGSATTFPVLSLLMAAACELACIRAMTKNDYLVYGDDIIIRHDAYQELQLILKQMGFSINKDKSFSGPHIHFRESCGMDAYAGEDVTPLRVSRTMASVDHSRIHNVETRQFRSIKELKNSLKSGNPRADTEAQFLASMMPYVEFYNRAVTFGYTFLSKVVLREFIIPVVPFSSDGALGLFSPNPSNFHLPTKFDKDELGSTYTQVVYWLGLRRRSLEPKEHQEDARLGLWFIYANERRVLESRDHRKVLDYPVQERIDRYCYIDPITVPVVDLSRFEVRVTVTPSWILESHHPSWFEGGHAL